MMPLPGANATYDAESAVHASALPAGTTPRVLAIVAKYPCPGLVKTRLGATLGHVEAAALYRAFLRDLARRFTTAAQRDGYTLVWAYAPGAGDLRAVVGSGAHLLAQRGADLAERLYHICVDLGTLGYRRIVVMSSDSPHLPATWVRAAFETLHQQHAVLGPAHDGGYYLVGVRADPEPPDLFRGITMSTPQVFTDTMERARALRVGVGMLPATFDVDDADDLIVLSRALDEQQTGVAAAPHTLATIRRLRRRGALPLAPLEQVG